MFRTVQKLSRAVLSSTARSEVHLSSGVAKPTEDSSTTSSGEKCANWVERWLKTINAGRSHAAPSEENIKPRSIDKKGAMLSHDDVNRP